MRILYPDLVYGAIASSGTYSNLPAFVDLKMTEACSAVTHAALSNWEYMEVIRQAADPKCSSHLEKSIVTIDTLLNFPQSAHGLKALFGLKDLQHDEDFASLLEVS